MKNSDVVTIFNYKPDQGWTTEQVSLANPDDNVSLQELLDRHQRGLLPEVNLKNPVEEVASFVGDIDLTGLENMTKLELLSISSKIGDFIIRERKKSLAAVKRKEANHEDEILAKLPRKLLNGLKNMVDFDKTKQLEVPEPPEDT